MKPKNALFLLIDGLRYDALADPASARILAPNLARLASEGYVLRGIANAQATQFVMPALFSQTYPLDHGGYNDGILDRPASFVECLADAGYDTHLVASCNQLSPVQGYDRGFKGMHTAADYRHLLEYRIEKTLRYHLERWQRGEIDEAEAIQRVAPDFDRLLAAIESDIAAQDPADWPARLRRVNLTVARRVPAERTLLAREPKTVLRKLVALPPILYWRWLGRSRIDPLARFWHRGIESLRWRSRTLAKRFALPFLVLTHYQVIAREVVDAFCRLIPKASGPWYVHFHVMDLHDAFVQSRPLHVIGKLRYLPRVFAARRAGATRRHALYDLSLAYVDSQVGRMLAALERAGAHEDTIILVTGDHGNRYAGSPRPYANIAMRTFAEDIEVPIALWGAGPAPATPGLIDSMGTSATLLDLLGVPGHASFKGVAAHRGGRQAVITESAGSGNADLVRNDLYFTVSTSAHRMMCVLRGDELQVVHLFDRLGDPQEMHDLAADPTFDTTTNTLLEILWDERGAILEARGAARPARSEKLEQPEQPRAASQ